MNIQHCLNELKNSAATLEFLEADGSRTQMSYARLYEEALHLLGAFQRAGAEKGCHVLLMQRGVRATITALWACWLGALAPVSGLRALANKPKAMEERHPNRLVFADKEPGIPGRAVIWPAPNGPVGEIVPMEDEDIALMQYTSGTASAPRCAMLTGANLYESGKASSVVVRPGVRERYANWLPLSHIFGLAANHLVPVYNGFDQLHVATERFLEDPSIWLSECARFRATITGSSTFGLELAIKYAHKLPKRTDLSSLYVCFWGGETLDPALYFKFEDTFAPFGWTRGVLRPAYGLSEASMGVAYNPPGASVRVDYIDPASVVVGKKLRFLEEGGMARVSLGVLDDCNDVVIRDEAGNPLPEEYLGTITVRGTNVMKGHYLPAPGEPENPKDGWLDTGDLGYFRKGWLAVLARSKDVICYHGENYVRTELERAAGIGALIETHGGLVLCCENQTIEAMRAAAERVGEAFHVPVQRAVTLERLPRNAKGIVDRVTLSAMWEAGQLKEHAVALFSGKSSLSARCAELAELWEQTLYASGFGDDSHFFSCGADSLAVVDLACAVEERFGVWVDPEELSTHPRLCDMAALVEQKAAERFEPLFERIDALLNSKKSAVVAIDGRCCAGKTTLAKKLSEQYGCAVLHMDDFFLPAALRTEGRLKQPGGNVEYERVDALLCDFSAGKAASYRPYRCDMGDYDEERAIEPGGLLIVEGAYSCHPALQKHYDLTVSLDVNEREQARRVRARNGEGADRFFDLWIPRENDYFAALKGTFRFDLAF
ncbi:MAG: AMP-binding protein [Christensenellales bacterium]|jgi:acyl-CoA synthetase (AMP-forming)/AMP-acid ligase II/acyl carrier protein